MILLEIIELNFCRLNKNTRRMIEQRGIDELLGDSGRDSSVGLNKVDINKDYYIQANDDYQPTEMNEKTIKVGRKFLEPRRKSTRLFLPNVRCNSVETSL